ncbi:molecular chaperone TorD family protein [Shewanella sp. D64]|uniref:TorD/DmsD family molecular chaperone n=1 Tax=unclassified Shewanella TaxID=196818 RepID=UPI0022BA2E38|nr:MULTISPECIES: molecular chaperone TorD family protein [unclassified Shewanella]MEC4726268.1 molecular chaperone TorD family protein [Shewanella sp. D64]MEC4738280.1 molecular chaperone TorD family protein [Shewanella sp. E94]WBJ95418.1 molecular chaperone TorD family protein [Shewanella sp. MTB7]
MTELVREISENDQLRADIYQLLAALLRRPPSIELLQFLANLEIDTNDDSEMTKAWVSIKLAAEQFSVEQLEDEYFNVFLGVGRGEILPYGSWFMTGSLMDKPLALLRQDLMQLGFEREENVKEPEDHVAALCEVMGTLILEAPSYRQLAFYQRHLSSWIARFCSELAKAPSAAFYATLAELAKAFFVIEANEFEQLSLNIPVNCPGNSDIEPVTEEVVKVN